MAGLKGLQTKPAAADAGDVALGVAAVADPAAASPAEASAGDPSAEADAAAPSAPPAGPDPELVAASERGDRFEADYLAQSDKLAAANAAIAKHEDELKERDATADTARATIARLEAEIVRLGAAPPAPPSPAEAAVKRPKVAKPLKLPEEGKRATWASVEAALEAGDLFQVALADDDARVQPWGPAVGAGELLTRGADELRFAPAIDLVEAMPACAVRHAVLLDASGKVLSSCRLGALLLGGGGLSALMPGNSLLFRFD